MALLTGEKAPVFDAIDINGRPVRLTTLRGRPLMLSFHRFSSCPFCNLRIHQLKTRYTQLHGQGLEVVTVFESTVAAHVG